MHANYERLDANEWNKLLLQSPYATPFHELEWIETTTSQFGGKVEPYLATYGDKQWLIPIYRNLPWTGPNEAQTFCIGYGGPLPTSTVEDGEEELSVSMRLLQSLAPSLGVTTLRATLYPAKFWPSDNTNPNASYEETCKIDIVDESEVLFNKIISGNARTAIRKSRKAGVVIRELDTQDASYKKAIAMLRHTQESVGSAYLTDTALVRAISSLKGPEVKSALYVAEIDAVMAGMALCIYNRRELFHLFHGWDRDMSHTSANQALQWEMLTKASSLEVESYNMGQYHTKAIKDAKLRWGSYIELVPKLLIKT